MTIRRKLAAGAAAVALAAGLGVAVAAPAQAISRTSCASWVLNLVSSSTTCWENAGYTTVTLYGVYDIIAGDNAGYVQGSGGTTYFAKWASFGIPTQTIGGIRIN